MTTPCIGSDPLCPCQDGDLCHYRSSLDGTTKGWEICLQQLQVAQSTRKYDGILPHKQALTLKLRDEGKTTQEIADFFRVTVRAAQMLIERGERRYQAMQLLKEGCDTRTIARKMRITQNTAARLIARGDWNEATPEN